MGIGRKVAMSITPFLKLQKPPFDSVPWDEAINGNMDTIDAFIARYMSVPNYVGGWQNNTTYAAGQQVLDATTAIIYQCLVTHTSSPVPTTFAQDRTTFPFYWTQTSNVSTPGVVISISDTPPANSKAGDFWFDSVGTQLYIQYSDGNSLQWVVVANTGSSTGEAPMDGNTYARRNGAWIQI